MQDILLFGDALAIEVIEIVIMQVSASAQKLEYR